MDAALRNRLTFGPLMAATALGLLYLDWKIGQWRNVHGVGLLAILLVSLPLGVRELAPLLAARQVRPYRFIAAGGVVLLILHAWATQFDTFTPYAAPTAVGIVVLTTVGTALRIAFGRTTNLAIVSMAGTALATLYVGAMGWFLMALRVSDGPLLVGSTVMVVFVLLTVKITDVGAFATGKLFGRHKLIAWLSPGKTWEGLAGGLLTAALVGAAMSPLIDPLPWYAGAGFGAILGLVGQGGDLLESMLKRDAAVKDSGAGIPGFGGVLDVIDSPLLAAPVAYLLFLVIQ